MAQGRNRVKSYKIHKMEAVPEEDWIVVQNTHEPLVDRETFEKAKQLLKCDTRTAPKQKQLYLFSGFLRCADCGRAMSRIVSKELYVYYKCGTYKSLSKKPAPCTRLKAQGLKRLHCTQFDNRYTLRLATPLSFPKLIWPRLKRASLYG
jgi:hypothetical protein